MKERIGGIKSEEQGMTREEALEFIAQSIKPDVNMAKIADAIKALEQENSDKQRYVVRGINNDKIEFIDKYSVRAFNRYIKFIKDSCKYEVLDKIRAEIEQLKLHKAQFLTSDNKVCIDSQEVLNIIDKYKPESEEV